METGYFDDNGKSIYVGDRLKSEWGYEVIVEMIDGEYVGKLVCDENHSCKDIPYSLNMGRGYYKQGINMGNKMITKEKLYELRISFIAPVIKLKYKKGNISVEMRDFIDYAISGENVILGFAGHSSIKLPLNQLSFSGDEKCFYVEEN